MHHSYKRMKRKNMTKDIIFFLIVVFIISSIFSLGIWWYIEKTTDEDTKDDLDYFENNDIEDNDMYMEDNDDIEFIKYWYS